MNAVETGAKGGAKRHLLAAAEPSPAVPGGAAQVQQLQLLSFPVNTSIVLGAWPIHLQRGYDCFAWILMLDSTRNVISVPV